MHDTHLINLKIVQPLHKPLQAVQLASHLQGGAERLSEMLYDRFVQDKTPAQTTPAWRWAADVTRQHVLAALVLTLGQTSINPLSNTARCLNAELSAANAKKAPHSKRRVALLTYLHGRHVLGFFTLAAATVFVGSGRASLLWDRHRLEDILHLGFSWRDPTDPCRYGWLGLPEYYGAQLAQRAQARQQHVLAAVALGVALVCACLLQGPRLALFGATYALDGCLAVVGVALGLTIGLGRMAHGLWTGHRPPAASMTRSATNLATNMIVQNKVAQASSHLLHEQQNALQAFYLTAQQIRQQMADASYFERLSSTQKKAFLTRLVEQRQELLHLHRRAPDAMACQPAPSQATGQALGQAAAFDAARLQRTLHQRRDKLAKNRIAKLTAFFAHGRCAPLGRINFVDMFDGVAAIERLQENLHDRQATSPGELVLLHGIRHWLAALRTFDEAIFSMQLLGMSGSHEGWRLVLKKRPGALGNPQAPLLHNQHLSQFIGAHYLRTTPSVLPPPALDPPTTP